MVIGLFGESCTGKSTIAEALSNQSATTIYSGKDYLKLAKNEAQAQKLFSDLLATHVTTEDRIIYVISEKEHLKLLPQGTIRILVTADLDLIKERFAKRMNGNLPAPVAAMLERKHGLFDEENCDMHIVSGQTPLERVCADIADYCAR